MTGELSTTSYAVLGLLSLRPWTTYELAKQMKRSFRFVWPRAERGLYDEPRRLVAAGYATAERGATGRRPRTVYSITPVGEEALRVWLAVPGAAPVVEFEGLVKVLFADHGTKADLLAQVRAIREQAEQTLAVGARLGREYAEGGGDFPERVHVNALAWRYLWEHHQAVARWAAWAQAEVDRWPGTDLSDEVRSWATATFAQVLPAARSGSDD